MFNYHDFDDIFDFDSNYSYDSAVVEAIESHRKRLEGLFIDKVLKLLDIKRRMCSANSLRMQLMFVVNLVAAKFYPPKSNGDLRSLHEIISAAKSADHTKLSILYYLLLDCNATMGQQAYSDSFEEKSCLPKRYQIFMKGLWHMDRLEFEVRSSLLH